VAATSEPPQPLPRTCRWTPVAVPGPLPTSGCARTLPGVRTTRRFGVRTPPPRVPGCPGLSPQVLHPQDPPWAQTPWTLRDIKGQQEPSAFTIVILLLDSPLLTCHHPPALLQLLELWGGTPSRCCQGASCQHRLGTPGKGVGCWWCHGQAGCGSPPHGHPTHRAW